MPSAQGVSGLLVLVGVTLVIAVGADPVAAQAPLGPDLQVDESGAGQQTFPHVVMGPGGGFMVSWDDLVVHPDLSGSRTIEMRRYARSGRPLGGSFAVVGPAKEGFGGSNLVRAPNGNLLVLWSDHGGADDRFEVFASVYDPAGQPIVEGLELNTHEPGAQSATAVAADGASNFIVTWWSIPPDEESGQDGSGSGVYARRLSATGDFLGPEFRVNTFTEGDQFPGSVAAAPDGSFVIVWTSVGQDGSDGGIYGQRFTAAGERAGGEFRINQHTESWQESPDVAIDPAGNFVVVWESFLQDGSEEGVYARRFDREGRPLSAEFRVNVNTFSYQELPRIAMDSAGNFVVVWLDWFTGPSLPDPVGRAFRPDGTPASRAFRINAFPRSDDDLPDVALSDTGTMVAVWQSLEQDGDSWGVFARRFAVPFPSVCVPSETALCLGEGRFRVEADWEIPETAAGVGRALPITSSAGAFSFFGPGNLELLVKVLPGCSANERFWVFAGGLTNLRVRLTVVDTATGTIRVYRNPYRRPFQPILDTAAFDTCNQRFATAASEHAPPPSAPGDGRSSTGDGTCHPDGRTLCLADGRFEVRATWRTAHGSSGEAGTLPLTADTGALWFFGADNPEVLVKVLDGCPVNGSRWVFAAGLTNVEVDLVVRDTVGGVDHTYHNPAGTPFRPVQDTTGFPTCGPPPAGTGG